MSIPALSANCPYLVVGHRGYPEQYPENCLEGLVAAAQLGAHCVELDVQFSQDNVPMVFHDAMLDRVTGVCGAIWALTADALTQISCHEPQRFAQRFEAQTKISRLEDVCLALAPFECEVFVEIKMESFIHIDRATALQQVAAAVQSIRSRVTLISYDVAILQMAKPLWRIGWVLSDLQPDSEAIARALAPNVLAYDVQQLDNDDNLWTGDWDWFLWDIVDPAIAQFWHAKQVRYIESWNPAALLWPATSERQPADPDWLPEHAN